MFLQYKFWQAVRTVDEENPPLAWLGKENYLKWQAPHLWDNRWFLNYNTWDRWKGFSSILCFCWHFEHSKTFTLTQKVSLKNYPSKSFWMVKESLSEHWGSGFSCHPPVLSGTTDFICETWHGCGSNTVKKNILQAQFKKRQARWINYSNTWQISGEFIESMSLLGDFPLSSYVHLFNDDVHAMAHHAKSKGPALHQGLGSDHLGNMVKSVWGWWWWWWRWW